MAEKDLNPKNPVAPIDYTADLACPILGLFGNDDTSPSPEQVDLHPFHIPHEHALNLDFVNESLGLDARVAVELSADDARQLVKTILEVLEQAEAGGHLE